MSNIGKDFFLDVSMYRTGLMFARAAAPHGSGPPNELSGDYITINRIGDYYNGATGFMRPGMSDPQKLAIGVDTVGNLYVFRNGDALPTMWNDESRKKVSPRNCHLIVTDRGFGYGVRATR